MKLTFRAIRRALLGCLLTLAAPSLAAQTTTGEIRGQVTDEEGAPLAGASVNARNLATGFQRATTTATASLGSR